MNRTLPLIAAVTCLAAALPALAAPASTQSCFRMRDMHNHSVVDANTIYASVGMHDVYKITSSNACFAAKWSSDPLITRVVAGSDIVCKPIDLDLKVGGSGGVSPCIVTGIQKLTPAEVAAIPKKLRP